MESDANQWEEIFKSAGHVLPEPALRVMEFAALLKERGATSVLDLGCGTGRHVVYLRKSGFHVAGFDYAPTGLELTRDWLQKEHLEADLILGDMRRSLPFRDDSFDALLSTQVIHHARLAAVLATAGEIQRLVCRGGMILISVPARKEVALDGQAYEEIEPNTFVPMGGSEKGLPHHLFTPDEFRNIFPQFEVLDLRVIDDKIIALRASKI